MIFWLIAIGLVVMAFKANIGGIADTASGAISSGVTSLGQLIGFDMSRLRYPGDNEDQQILAVAANTGVDPRLLAAIRLQENGGPGRQYGILSVNAPTLADQLQIAANTIKNNVGRYQVATGESATDDTGRYTSNFIAFLSNRWAPVGASNDPNGLNQYWYGNVLNNYYSTEVTA